MTGEGSDEVLAGYDLFLETKVRNFFSRNPASAKRAEILARLYPWMSRNPSDLQSLAKTFFSYELDPADPFFSHHLRWNTGLRIGNLLHPDFKKEWTVAGVEEELRARLPVDFMKWDSLERAQWLEIKTLLPGYILSAQGDRMLMAHSVEGRFPFLDVELVEFSRHLPARDKIQALNEKHLLKLAFKDEIPAAILQRPKQPYRSPDTESFFSGLAPQWLSELCDEREIARTSLFNSKAVKLLLDKCLKTNGRRMSNTDNMSAIFFLSTMLISKQFTQMSKPYSGDEIPAEPLKIIYAEEKNGKKN
jgi:asparagine synthase (glutamine-hydrolysing)